jgi:polyphosphate kinase
MIPDTPQGSRKQLALTPYLNRELSWLQFNERVLGQAGDAAGHPLLERVKFLSIAANNLDRFLMVRVATLLRAQQTGVAERSADGLDAVEQLRVVRRRVSRFFNQLHACWETVLRPALTSQHIFIVDRAEYVPGLRSHLSACFRAEIFPVLTPLAFDLGHPFPFIPNRSKNLAVVVRRGRRSMFARVEVPDGLPRLVEIPADVAGCHGTAFAMLEDIIVDNIHDLFPGLEVRSAHLFRILRDTDVVLPADPAEDLPQSVDRRLKQLRHGTVTLVQVDRGMPSRVLDILRENFEVEEDVVSVSPGRMAFADWAQLTTLDRPELKDPPLASRTPWHADGSDSIFSQVGAQDVLVHHPFDSFSAVDAFLRAAVRDPLVVAIKMTLYRLEAHSPFIDLLIEAADRGKQVAVAVELRARFDERSNIRWAARLDAAGIHVAYGQAHLKTHCKICLVVRHEAGGIRRYVHIGTGNYNSATALMYTDLGVFTSREEIVADVSELFNYLTGYSGRADYQALLVAPINMRARLKALVEREADHARAGRPAHLVFKVNAISDPEFIADLYEACRAGVTVDLIVRGICCARPGIPGTSQRMTVRSIVGRFLEHTRLYAFGNGGNEEIYLGSADLMERNFDRRVEVLCPVLDPGLRWTLRHVLLDAYLRDNSRAHILQSDGTYTLLTPREHEIPFSAQEFLLARDGIGRSGPAVRPV